MKRTIAIVLAVVTLLSLTACQTQPEKPQEESQPLFADADTSDHISMKINEKLAVDADVIYTADGITPKIYSGHYMQYSKEQIDAFLDFCGDQMATVKREGVSDEYYYYTGTCASGFEFYYETYAEGATEYAPISQLAYYMVPATPGPLNPYMEYPIYGAQSEYDENADWYLGHLFMDPVDLSFATAAEAEAEVREALSVLGVENLVTNRTLYLSPERLEQAQETLQEPRYVEHFGEFPDRSWSEDEGCYIFEFTSSIDGVPTSIYPFLTDTSLYVATEIRVYYSAEGIIYLLVQGAWAADEVVEEPESFLSPSAALETAVRKFESMISPYPVTIERLSLTYMYFQDGSRWLLKPVWLVRYWEDTGDIHAFKRKTLFVDAVTGEDI